MVSNWLCCANRNIRWWTDADILTCYCIAAKLLDEGTNNDGMVFYMGMGQIYTAVPVNAFHNAS
jgi:hypothetical protein